MAKDDYDPAEFDRPSVTVDVVMLAMVGEGLRTLLVRRAEQPFAGRWALPGTFVGIAEGLEEAAVRVLRDKAGVEHVAVEQLYTFGAVDRDPRMRIISVGYLALTTAERFACIEGGDGVRGVHLQIDEDMSVTATDRSGAALPLAFDHGEILRVTVERLRGKIDYSTIAFQLLPELFTLRQLQAVHEAILGHGLNKSAFRRRMLDRGWLDPTGEREVGASFRPAELYRLKPDFAES